MIKIQGLCHSVHSKFRLELPELSFPRGLTLLVGRNGAGKSTLLRFLATASFPAAGMIRYREAPAANNLPLIRSRIGYVPTDVELYEGMSPRQLLSYLAEMKGLDRKSEPERLLHLFNLVEVQQTKISRLAQGVKQRLAIAQAFLGSPEYLFLDEPLRYLDELERKKIAALLNHQARNSVIVAATHELDVWSDIDQLVWLDKGKACFSGPPYQWVHVEPYLIFEGFLSETTNIPSSALLSEKRIHGKRFVTLFGEHSQYPDLSTRQPSLEESLQIRIRTSKP